MTLPLVVEMTVDTGNSYELSAETNQHEINLDNELEINVVGYDVPEYEGSYTVDAGLSPVVLNTQDKRLTQNVTVNALTENSISSHTLTINQSTGKVSTSVQVTPGYNDATLYSNKTLNLSTEAGKTVTPTTSEQYAVYAHTYTLGDIKVGAIPTGTAGIPTATKGAVSNHSISVTPSVTNTTGYITGSTINGTAVSVSASELVSGSLSITTNNTYDVTNYASAVVNVQGGVTPTGTINISANGTYDVTNFRSAVVSVSGVATGTFTPTENTGTVTINTGLNSITAIFIYPEENPNLNSSYYSIYGAWSIPNGPYQKAVSVRGKGTSGRGFEQWISTTPPHTINGGSITISYPNASGTGYFTAVTYRWYAW